jgi:hypothetical protein
MRKKRQVREKRLVETSTVLNEISKVAEWLKGRNETTCLAVWTECLGKSAKSYDQAAAFRTGIMVRTYCRWVRSPSIRKVDGASTRIYLPPPANSFDHLL